MEVKLNATASLRQSAIVFTLLYNILEGFQYAVIAYQSGLSQVCHYDVASCHVVGDLWPHNGVRPSCALNE